MDSGWNGLEPRYIREPWVLCSDPRKTSRVLLQPVLRPDYPTMTRCTTMWVYLVPRNHVLKSRYEKFYVMCISPPKKKGPKTKKTRGRVNFKGKTSLWAEALGDGSADKSKPGLSQTKPNVLLHVVWQGEGRGWEEEIQNKWSMGRNSYVLKITQ